MFPVDPNLADTRTVASSQTDQASEGDRMQRESHTYKLCGSYTVDSEWTKLGLRLRKRTLADGIRPHWV
jgi:hypothetical protein